MANTFGTDILIQSPDPESTAAFYVECLGFTVTSREPMMELHGPHINLYIEKGPPPGPVLEVTVANVEEATARLTARGSTVVRDEPNFPRRHICDPNGLICNLTTSLPSARLSKGEAGRLFVSLASPAGNRLAVMLSAWRFPAMVVDTTNNHHSCPPVREAGGFPFCAKRRPLLRRERADSEMGFRADGSAIHLAAEKAR
jgi:predicted enzyme related to lactoylglutathione lyase